MTSKDRYNAARSKYLAQNPEVSRQIDVVIAESRAAITAVGSTVEEVRQLRQIEAFAAEAKARGFETHEFVIRLMADSPEQAQEWRLERHRQIADSLGMDWADYKELNRIK